MLPPASQFAFRLIALLLATLLMVSAANATTRVGAISYWFPQNPGTNQTQYDTDLVGGVDTIALANPNNGILFGVTSAPGAHGNAAAYGPISERLAAKGIHMLGYVPVGYFNQACSVSQLGGNGLARCEPLERIRAQVQQYAISLPALKGILFDEAFLSVGDANAWRNAYASLRQVVLSVRPDWRIAFNPGTPNLDAVTAAQPGELLLLFEGPASSYLEVNASSILVTATTLANNRGVISWHAIYAASATNFDAIATRARLLGVRYIYAVSPVDPAKENIWGSAADLLPRLNAAFGTAAPALARQGHVLLRASGGNLLLGRLEGLTLAFTTQPNPGAATRVLADVDVDGSGARDLVWQRTDQGAFLDVNVWSDYTDSATTTWRSVKPTWAVESAGDLDGDGLADLVWRYTTAGSADTSVAYIWFSNGRGVGQVRKRGGAPLNWRLLGAADLNDDRAADLIWLSPANNLRILMATADRSCANIGGGTLGSAESVLAVGSFRRSGSGDLLVRDTQSGALRLHALDATHLVLPAPTGDLDDPNASCTVSTLNATSGSLALPIVDASWRIWASADLNGDGLTDVLWQKPDGRLVLWLMRASPAAPQQIDNVGSVPAGYGVVP